MKNIPLDKLEQFRHEWQSEVAETLDDFLRSKATCISDRMEQELVEISQLKAKIQRVYDNILTSESNPDLVYDMVGKTRFQVKTEQNSFRFISYHIHSGLLWFDRRYLHLKVYPVSVTKTPWFLTRWPFRDRFPESRVAINEKRSEE